MKGTPNPRESAVDKSEENTKQQGTEPELTERDSNPDRRAAVTNKQNMHIKNDKIIIQDPIKRK